MISSLPIRIAAIGAALSVASCGKPSVAPDISQYGGEPVECALDGAAEFAAQCRMVQRAMEGGRQLTIIYSPDGGFRRFDTLSPALVRDGALEAQTVVEGEYMVLSVDRDRYRWPKAKWGG